MAAASTPKTMSPQLMKVAQRAKREPEAKFHSLAHLLDLEALQRAFAKIRKDAAEGVDGVTKAEYGAQLEANLERLLRKLKDGTYRHQPIRRVHIPKANGKTRPLGISCVEDKVVQGALKELLETIYEQDFYECSIGFRPQRRAHTAVKAINQAGFRGRAKWIIEADIASFFDSVDRTALRTLLGRRIADGKLMKLIGKCLNAGVLETGDYTEPDEGTVQGSILSPMLGNIYLHYVLDQWLEETVRPRLKGSVMLLRYADDFIIAFEREDDARRVYEVVGKRFERFGLKLHPAKTRLIDFRPPRKEQTGSTESFDFLGFRYFWRRTRRGALTVGCKTRSEKLARTLKEVSEWCRGHRHLPVKDQHTTLWRKINGHFNYFGINGNLRSLSALIYQVERIWFKWLRRRGQRCPLSWERFRRLLRDYPLPHVNVRVQVWA